ncbi:MAG: xanthan lyase [Candidatus Sumerlaeia bacterium]
MRRWKRSLCVLVMLLSTAGMLSYSRARAADEVQPPPAPASPPASKQVEAALKKFVVSHRGATWESLIPPQTVVKSVVWGDHRVTVDFNISLTYQPIREERVAQLTQMMREQLASLGFSDVEVHLTAEGRALRDYIPRSLMSDWRWPEKPAPAPGQAPWVRRADPLPPPPTNGLYGRTIALWHSHGLYYDENSGRWQWQRPRMFTLVEDKLPMSFVLPFLVPMLENAGAMVLLPRERSWQIHEVIVDDADEGGPSQFRLEGEGWERGTGAGFRNGLTPLEPGVYPHRMGGHRVIRTVAAMERAAARAVWIPDIPADGTYPVYITYNASPERTASAHYRVIHTGGATDYLVNQRVGGNVWVYVGEFYFRQGVNPDIGRVELLNDAPEAEATVSADAVRFGGGVDDVKRGDGPSGRPRYLMGSETYLQYMGFLEHFLVSPRWNNYTKDYGGRGEWVNYISGPPNTTNFNREFGGLGVPVDLSFAFHTDAGITTGVVGTLAIYRVADEDGETTFPDLRSRWLNRDYSDLVQTQIVEDVRRTFSSTWVRRQLREASYAEIRRPNCPSALLELLSHQDFDDAKYALDPRFRFVVARAVYKGMLRFLAQEYGFEPVVAPLAPDHLRVQATGPGAVRISWQPRADALEPSAVPDHYVITISNGRHGPSMERLVEGTSAEIEGLDPDAVYCVRVRACNRGGVSLPGEQLAFRTGRGGEKKAVVVNGFDRLAPPAFVQEAGFQGVARFVDKGVPYLVNFSLTGDMYEFDPVVEFQNNDYPGHGASYGDLEAALELGNTFDYTVRHGEAIAAAGWAFDSASDEAVGADPAMLAGYDLVDWLLGEERGTPPYVWGDPDSRGYPDRMQLEFRVLEPAHQTAIRNYLAGGGKLFISGAYIATDLGWAPWSGKEDKAFLKDTLQGAFNTNFGSRTNNVVPAGGKDDPFAAALPSLHFSAGLGEDGVYGVESPDSINPAPKSKAFAVLRYADGGFCAAIAAREPHKVIVFGFPFETIVGEQTRAEVMKQILEF